MPVSFAGVSLPLATPQLEELLATRHPLDLVPEFDSSYWSGYCCSKLPTPPEPEVPPVRIGVLRWPTGASRFATFHAVVNSEKLDEIRDAIGVNNTAQDLILGDSRDEHSITASMWMLPPRPLAQMDFDNDDGHQLYLLTLVDLRFYLRWKQGTLEAGSESWADLFELLAELLGIELVVDTVPAAYQQPSSVWSDEQYPQLTAVLDAAAAAVGQKVVFNLDGTARTVKWETAQTESDDQFENDEIVKFLGGQFYAEDIARYVPASVTVKFLKLHSVGAEWIPAPDPFTVEVTLDSLNLANYGSAVGVAGYSASRSADFAYYGYNFTDCDALAEQAATDWYGWRLADRDVSIPGVQDWSPTGWEDVIEWTVRLTPEKFSSTRLVRDSWFYFPTGDSTGDAPTTTTPPPCTGSCSWLWSTGALEWVKVESDCSVGCACFAPLWCPPDDFRLVTTETACGPFEDDQPAALCNGSTTTPAPPCTTTTIDPAACGTCTYIRNPYSSGFGVVVGNDWEVVEHSDSCTAGNGCFCPKHKDFPELFPTEPEEEGDYCFVLELKCRPNGLPPAEGKCKGECQWVWVENLGGWVQLQGCAAWPGRYCTCTFPDYTPDGLEPGDCYYAKTCCFDYLNPACNPCEPTSTTEPPPSCRGDCLWYSYYGDGKWILVSSCPGCCCELPARDPEQSRTDSITSACIPCATTTTAAPTTTTSDPACAGSCSITCAGPEGSHCEPGSPSWYWIPSSWTCPSGCYCQAYGLIDPTLFYALGTTLSAGCDGTPPSTTTTDAPCGSYCTWNCNYADGCSDAQGVGNQWTLGSIGCFSYDVSCPDCLYPDVTGTVNEFTVTNCGTTTTPAPTTTTTTTGPCTSDCIWGCESGVWVQYSFCTGGCACAEPVLACPGNTAAITSCE